MTNLPRIDAEFKKMAANAGAVLHSFQSNHEGALIDRIRLAGSDGSDQALGVISGLGVNGNRLAVQHLLSLRTSAAT